MPYICKSCVAITYHICFAALNSNLDPSGSNLYHIAKEQAYAIHFSVIKTSIKILF